MMLSMLLPAPPNVFITRTKWFAQLAWASLIALVTKSCEPGSIVMFIEAT